MPRRPLQRRSSRFAQPPPEGRSDRSPHGDIPMRRAGTPSNQLQSSNGVPSRFARERTGVRAFNPDLTSDVQEIIIEVKSFARSHRRSASAGARKAFVANVLRLFAGSRVPILV